MERLNILWTTDNKEVFFTMLSMYATNSKLKNWWSEVNLIIWGPSAKLVSEDPQIQNDIIEMMHAGVHIEACKACADHYGVADKLEKLGIHVRFMGVALTQYLKGNETIITL